MDLYVPIKLVFSIVFAIAGTLFLCIAYREWCSSYSIITQGIETEGIVVETFRKPRRTGEPISSAAAPVVQFMTQSGEVKKYYSSLYTTPCYYEPGQQVSIWYLPNDPTKATLNGKDAWILPIVFGIFGFVICLITYSVLIGLLIKRVFG
jgi:hypothetical protein